MAMLALLCAAQVGGDVWLDERESANADGVDIQRRLIVARFAAGLGFLHQRYHFAAKTIDIVRLGQESIRFGDGREPSETPRPRML